jgi:aspartate/methionine/tyrosine aminotransferase
VRADGDFISKRTLAVDASGIRKVFDLAAKLKDPINLSIGLPDFDVPEAAKLAAIEAIRAGANKYTPTQGWVPLRDRLRADLAAEMGRDVGDVLITSGVAGGLLLAILATINPGEEAVFLDPYFVMYKHMMTMAGGVGVPVDSYPDFRFRAEAVEKSITPRTKLLILNSPSNPTGLVMSETEVRAAVELARKHDLLIISDEIYEPFLYDAERVEGGLPSPARHYARTILLRGFSKSHAMTGWRIGYAAGPAAVLQQMAKLQQYTFICAPAPLQQGALASLDTDMAPAVAAYRKKRDLVYGRLSKAFEVTHPEGAFYIFPKAPEGAPASQFVARGIESNVLTIPGNVFSERDTHFRISYATSDSKLIEGCDILCRLAKQ